MSEFDNTYPFEEGLDPTSTWGSYASALLQMIREARPSTLYGMVICSTDTPPTTGVKEWHKRSIWIKTPTPPATQYLAWYYDNNTGSWEYLDRLLNTILADGSVTLVMLDPTQGSALQLLRKNAANTGHEYVSPSSIFPAASIDSDRIIGEGTTGDRHIMMSVDGLTIWADISTTFFYLLEESGLRIKPTNLAGTDSVTGSQAADYKVLSIKSADGATHLVNWRALTDLIQANTIPFSKMLYPPGSQGLTPKVNASRNDLEFYAPTVSVAQKFAIIIDQKAVNTDGDAFTGAGPHTLTLNTPLYDPDSLLVSLSGNRFVPIAGKYLCTAIVPVYENSGGSEFIIYIVNVTLGSIVASISATNTEFGVSSAWTIEGAFEADGADEYAIFIKGHAPLDIIIGESTNVLAEVYTQVKLHRYAD